MRNIGIQLSMRKNETMNWFVPAAIVLAASVGSLVSLHARQAQGPVTPPRPAQAGKSAAAPPVPVDEIIKKFAAKEAEFREALGNYTYTQSFVIQDWGPTGERGGEYRLESDIIFTPDGKRIEKVTYAPPPTLQFVTMSPSDLKDIESVMPFSLTPEQITKYNIEYVGREHVDEIGTYVFKVSPKEIKKGERYFEGTIWVDDEDLQIVKSSGKSVPETRKGNQEDIKPHFETYREQIDGKYWFPTYTRADDTLHFKEGDARIRIVLRYTNYKQFKSTIKITPVDPPPKKP